METQMGDQKSVKVQWYHNEVPLCQTRAKYRQGRKLTAVKVYTVLNESCHLLIDNVTCVDVKSELFRLCRRFGRVVSFQRVADYSTEKFTATYSVQYARIAAARYAKRSLDTRNFYGTLLKVCYTPELESWDETVAKMQWRQKSYINGLHRNRMVQPSAKAATSSQHCSSETCQTANELSELPVDPPSGVESRLQETGSCSGSSRYCGPLAYQKTDDLSDKPSVHSGITARETSNGLKRCRTLENPRDNAPPAKRTNLSVKRIVFHNRKTHAGDK